MRLLVFVSILVLCDSVCHAVDLPRSTPEEQGVASTAILAFIESADRDVDSLNSFMLVRHGHVVAEGWWAPYHAQARHSLYSLSKSFTSTAVGLAAAEGKLSIDDPVLSFFPQDAPADVSDNLKAMRVSDLLRMNTGHQTEPSRKPDEIWTKAFLAHPVPFKPGTHFLYNTSATYMQSAIVQKVTGLTVLDYLGPRLFEPLGIEKPTWETSPQGISTGGYGLSIRTEDIARFGQLYLQKGKWQGKQLVPESWIEAATARQTSNGSSPASDWDQGYGYQFWRCRHGAYRGDGAFGQYCIVLPDQDAVIAITSGLRDMQAVMNLIWDKLLPGMKATALAADQDSRAKLEHVLKGLSIRPQTASGSAAKVAGKKYVFPPNDLKLEAITVHAEAGDGGGVTVAMRIDGTEHRNVYRSGKWTQGKSAWGVLREQPVATSGGWSGDGTLTTKVCFYETPFVISADLKFVDDELRLSAKSNVGFGPRNDVQLIGVTAEFTQETAKFVVNSTSSASSGRTNQEAAASTGAAGHDFVKWEKEVAAYEAADKSNPPPKGGILFVGSSTIRLWKTLAEDFPNYKVINRGIGGSEIVDSTYFADRIIFPYEPRQIYLRAGGNDLHAGRLPKEIAADFAVFVKTIHARLPKTEIYYIAVNPAPSRWGEKDKNKALNDLIREQAINMPRVGFVDAYDFTLGPDGSGRKELFVDDMLHFNAEGYKLMAARVRPFLPTPPPK